jgi:PKD repeat protein
MEQSIQPDPSLSMGGPLPVEESSRPLAVSADNDLNGLFVGTVAITLPNYLPSSDLILQLSDVSKSLTGYISPTLAYPADPGTGHGPALTGSWSGNHFTLQSQPFVTHISQDITITRTLKFESGVISTTQTTRILSGVYVETLAGLTLQPLEMRGVFQVQRPLRLLEAAFDASPKVVAAGDNVFFSDLSIGNPTSWSWTFGDGGASTQQNPVHHYNALGDYTVSLTIGDGSGNNQLTKTGFISVIASNTAPTADFSASPLEGLVPLMVNFVDHSVGGATSWLWEFGDGKTSTQQNPTHVYVLPGTYTVSLTVSNSHGSDKFTWNACVTVTGVAPKRIYMPLLKK